MSQVTTKPCEGTYTVNSFPENLIIYFENPHSNFQGCIVGFEGCIISFEDCIVGFEDCVVILELRDDTILNIDFSI